MDSKTKKRYTSQKEERTEKEETSKKMNDEEYVFKTSEGLEVYSSFDDMGLRDDLIKGK
jgi:hypothetical protein